MTVVKRQYVRKTRPGHLLPQGVKRRLRPDPAIRLILHLDCNDGTILTPHWCEVTTGSTFLTWNSNIYGIVAAKQAL